MLIYKISSPLSSPQSNQHSVFQQRKPGWREGKGLTQHRRCPGVGSLGGEAQVPMARPDYSDSRRGHGCLVLRRLRHHVV